MLCVCVCASPEPLKSRRSFIVQPGGAPTPTASRLVVDVGAEAQPNSPAPTSTRRAGRKLQDMFFSKSAQLAAIAEDNKAHDEAAAAAAAVRHPAGRRQSEVAGRSSLFSVVQALATEADECVASPLPGATVSPAPGSAALSAFSRHRRTSRGPGGSSSSLAEACEAAAAGGLPRLDDAPGDAVSSSIQKLTTTMAVLKGSSRLKRWALRKPLSTDALSVGVGSFASASSSSLLSAIDTADASINLMALVEVDTIETKVTLSEELKVLVMRLAINYHEEWAARKVAAGVVYGSDDAVRDGTHGSGSHAHARRPHTRGGRRPSTRTVVTSPLLVPFSLLPGKSCRVLGAVVSSFGARVVCTTGDNGRL